MKARVLVVAPGRKVKGGITSVVRAHSTLSSWASWRCAWIETTDGGSRLAKAAAAGRALASFIVQLPVARIVHIHVSWKNGAVRKLPFFLLSKLWRRATIVHLHAPDMNEAGRGVRGAALRYMLRRADRVVVLSEHWRSAAVDAAQVDGCRITVVPNPVAARTANRVPAPATILFVGKLEERKGITILIEAFQRLRAIRPDAELRLAGDNTSFLDRYSKPELEGIRVLGWLSPEVLEEERRRATCLCLPSRGEGVPMAVLEAMASGCPVITTLVGGLVDVIRHDVNGFVVPVDDVDALCEAILHVIEDRNSRERVAATAARQVIETHGVQYVDRRLSELYSDTEACHVESAAAGARHA